MNNERKIGGNMTTRVMESTAASAEGYSNRRRALLRARIYFALMIFGIWLGIGLPATWGGFLNIGLLAVGAYSTYKVFTGIRIVD